VLRALRPGSRIPRANTSRSVSRIGGLRVFELFRGLQDPTSMTMGRIRLRSDSGIGVQPRTDLQRSKGRGQDKTRRDHGAGRRARRMRPIAILVEGLHPPNNSKIRSPEIRESRRVLTWPPSRRSKPHRTRLNGFAGRGDPRDQATGFGPWNPRPGRIATGIPRLTRRGEWSRP
jgi:hypothetical protein